MYIAHATRTGRRFSCFNAARDLIGALDVVYLDVHHADTQLDARIDLSQRLQIIFWPMRQLQDQMIAVQLV